METTEFNLAANPSSCGEARTEVLRVLDGAPDNIRDTAALLTSELVANALLHAASPLTLRVIRDGPLVRVEVGDAGTMPPAVKPYGPDSRTGRGLKMLDALAEQWGWQPSEPGKTVWFELSEDGRRATGVSRGMRRPSDAVVVDPYPSGVPIVFIHAPVQAMIRSGACYDALYRELRSRAADDIPAAADGAPAKLLDLLGELSTHFRGFGRNPEEIWERAISDALTHVDVSFRLPREAGSMVEAYGRLLDGVEGYCQEWLPKVVPTDEARAVRRWAFGEVTRQCRGEQPRPWKDVDST